MLHYVHAWMPLLSVSLTAAPVTVPPVNEIAAAALTISIENLSERLPVPATGDQHEINVKALPPILVVSTTNDPATPYKAGVDLAQQLGGTLVTFEGTQHTVVFQGNTCIDDIAARYLVDVTVPPPNTRC